MWSITTSANTRGRDAVDGIVVARLALWFSMLGEVGSACGGSSQARGGEACAARCVRLVAAESRRHEFSRRRHRRAQAHTAGQPRLGMPRSYLRPDQGAAVGSPRVRAGAAGAETAPPRTAARASWRASPPPPPKLVSAPIWLSRCTHADHARTATPGGDQEEHHHRRRGREQPIFPAVAPLQKESGPRHTRCLCKWSTLSTD